jgi:hypothetical protein
VIKNIRQLRGRVEADVRIGENNRGYEVWTHVVLPLSDSRVIEALKPLTTVFTEASSEATVSAHDNNLIRTQVEAKVAAERQRMQQVIEDEKRRLAGDSERRDRDNKNRLVAALSRLSYSDAMARNDIDLLVAQLNRKEE